jgi:hypothetical protein
VVEMIEAAGLWGGWVEEPSLEGVVGR